MKLTYAEKLQLLSAINMRSGITHMEFHDVRNWIALSGDGNADEVLSEKALENIDALYRKFFVV